MKFRCQMSSSNQTWFVWKLQISMRLPKTSSVMLIWWRTSTVTSCSVVSQPSSLLLLIVSALKSLPWLPAAWRSRFLLHHIFSRTSLNFNMLGWLIKRLLASIIQIESSTHLVGTWKQLWWTKGPSIVIWFLPLNFWVDTVET